MECCLFSTPSLDCGYVELIILVFMGLSVLLCENVIVTNDLSLLLTLVEKNLIFSLLVLEGVIIESRTEPRSRISLLLVNKFLLLTNG
jgi:hypothetical protein